MYSLPARSVLFVLQADLPVEQVNVDVTTGLGGGAFGTFVSTLVVGAVLLVLAPDWTRARMRDVAREPVDSFAYGVAALLAAIIVVVLLFLTILGIPFALLLGFGLYLAWVVGAVVAYLAIADRFVAVDDDWVVALAVAAILNAVLTITGVGAIVSFCIGAAGFGTVLRA